MFYAFLAVEAMGRSKSTLTPKIKLHVPIPTFGEGWNNVHIMD